MIRLQVNQLSKTYRNAFSPAVDSVSFDLTEGALLALVGESGSGKTTVLRLIAGLENPDTGTIKLDGGPISSPEKVVPPERRGIGLVFQHHALFPHLTVSANVAFGLKAFPGAERKGIVAQMLELVDLASFGNRYPHQLSGGERQRVALARALAPGPRLLLLDEPFSSLDARLRQTVRDETRSILKQRGATALFVTHDTGDALSIADQIVVLKNGQVQQTGSPCEVYGSPANAYVASFFGTCNFLPLFNLDHPDGVGSGRRVGPPEEKTSSAEGIWVRPEDLELVSGEHPGLPYGIVSNVAYHGAYLEVMMSCSVAGSPPFNLLVRHQGVLPVEAGSRWTVAARRRGN